MFKNLVLTTLLATLLVCTGANAATLRVQFSDGSPVTGINVCVDTPNCAKPVSDYKGETKVSLAKTSTLYWSRSGASAQTPSGVSKGSFTASNSDTKTLVLKRTLSGSEPSLSSSEANLLFLLNGERRKRGLSDLVADTSLNRASDYQTTWLNQSQPGDSFDGSSMHKGMYNTELSFRTGEAGYSQPIYVAETAQWNPDAQEDNQSIIDVFKGSKPHWDILMSKDYKKVGVSKTGKFVIIDPALNYDPPAPSSPTPSGSATPVSTPAPAVASAPKESQASTVGQSVSSTVKPSIPQPQESDDQESDETTGNKSSECSMSIKKTAGTTSLKVEGSCISGGRLLVKNQRGKAVAVKHGKKSRKTWKISKTKQSYTVSAKTKQIKKGRLQVKVGGKTLTWKI